ncbi:MAG: hypothetical protein ABN482_13705 [Corticimicrobacter sp.]|uniref:hypothetical protein n=1 Tax=Corticimicrobacter sp. TaxID=2678536 RepID=UPI0032DAC705
MSKAEKGTVQGILLQFAHLGTTGQDEFIGMMNEFLLSSPKQRRALTRQWKQHMTTSEQASCPGKPGQHS